MPEARDIPDDEAARLWDEFRAAEDPRAYAVFERLYRSFLPTVVRYCRFRLRDPHLAEDVANTVFVRMLETRPVLKSSFVGLVLRTARNLCAEEFAAQPPLLPRQPGCRNSDESDPGRELERADMHAALADCLGRLPEGDQTLVILHDGEGLTYREIREIVGLRVASSTLGRRLKAIKAKLLACLREKRCF